MDHLKPRAPFSLAIEEILITHAELLGEATLAKLQSGAFDEDLMAKFTQAAAAAEVVEPKDGEKEPEAPPEKEPEAPPAEEG